LGEAEDQFGRGAAPPGLAFCTTDASEIDYCRLKDRTVRARSRPTIIRLFAASLPVRELVDSDIERVLGDPRSAA